MYKNKYAGFITYFFIAFFTFTIMIFTTPSSVSASTDTVSATTALTAKTTKKVKAKETASKNAPTIETLPNGHAVIIQGEVTNQNIKWYRCKFTYNQKSVIGYIPQEHIKKVKRFVKTTGKVNNKVSSFVNVRKSASLNSTLTDRIKKGTTVTILSKKTVKKETWYQIQYSSSGKKKKGWILGTYITLTKTTTTANGNDEGLITKKAPMYLSANTKDQRNDTLNKDLNVRVYGSITVGNVKWYKINANGKTGYVKASYIDIIKDNFSEMLKKFPKSYQGAIKALHNKYPNWRFVAVNTKLDWKDVMKNESIVGKNTIQSNAPNFTNNALAPFSYLSTEPGAYNWKNDKYAVKDGVNWYSADSKVIAHYIDPRNFLTEDTIFQFETLAYDSSQKKNVVTKILSNTFMKGSYSVKDSKTNKTVSGNYNTAFMTAGKKAGASPYFLAARVKQEVGLNGSGSTSGTYKGYEGIYNFYNIGAFDSSTGHAVANGLLWAKGGNAKATTYGRPWTNPYKSIVGGAQYVSEQYIKVGQNTLYFQKFNVVNKSSLYAHQYMTNVQAPHSEGRTKKTAYQTLGVMSNPMIFFIPVYENMPEEPCKLPATKGNPNAYLKSITLKDDTGEKLSGLTPTFQYDVITGYELVVKNDVERVHVTASTVSKHATITSGTGVYELTPGKTKEISIQTLAGNGSKKTYTIKIKRQS